MLARNVFFSRPAQCLAGHGGSSSVPRQTLLKGRIMFQRLQIPARQFRKPAPNTNARGSESLQMWNPTIRNLAVRKTPTLLFQSRSRFPDLFMRFAVGGMCYAYAAFHAYSSVLYPPEGFHPYLRRMVQVVVVFMAAGGSFIMFRRIRGVRSITAVPIPISTAGQQQPLMLQIRISRIIPYGPKAITVPCRDVTLTQPLFVGSPGQSAKNGQGTDMLRFFTLPFRIFGTGIQKGYKELQNLFWQEDNPLLSVKGHKGTFNVDADSRSFALDNGARLNEIVRKSFA